MKAFGMEKFQGGFFQKNADMSQIFQMKSYY